MTQEEEEEDCEIFGCTAIEATSLFSFLVTVIAVLTSLKPGCFKDIRQHL